ncbi:Zinc finger MYM-type protein 1 [Amphibalanus amphitrite]|uniref:Zinc finger MYM-type protein 1 n=1 Tax=Amphibalanus amphitrite TaxID=1232801 RepID=A0A6A4WAL9_AMPAM|nr:Zinc finger MYM-type protein 1 [Amphibalanus amphitrite]
MLQFRFFFGVRLAQHVLKITTPVMRSVQGQTQSVSENMSLMDGLKTAVAGQRDRFDEFWAATVHRAKELGVDDPRSIRQSRPPRRLDDGAPPAHPATPRDAYRRVYYETLDRLLASIESRYAHGDQQLLVEAERALLTGDAADIARAAVSFGLGGERTCLHVQMLRDICKQRGIALRSLSDVVSALQDASIRTLLPDCVTLVKLLLTAPATSCTAERSFSVLRRLKNWLRSTISQERLSQAAVLASYPEKVDALDIEKEMREFAAQTAQRVNAFGRW